MRMMLSAAGFFSRELFSKISSYLQKVFIKTLGWNLKSKRDRALHRFDREDIPHFSYARFSSPAVARAPRRMGVDAHRPVNSRWRRIFDFLKLN